MTPDQAMRADRALNALIDELADARTPDYLEAAIERASSSPQRPAWTFPGRWFPMDITTEAAPPARIPLRTIAILALLALLVVALAAALYIGSRPRLPAPYGPAANGVVAYSKAGDIVVADPITGAERVVVGGAQADTGPRFSRDGTRIAFERLMPAPDTGSHVLTVAPDGSGLTPLTTTPLDLYRSSMATPYTFSPDGRTVAIVAADPRGAPGVYLAPVDGGEGRWLGSDGLDDRLVSIREPAFRPPAGDELLLTGDRSGAGPIAFVVDVGSGKVLRNVAEAPADGGLDTARWSPDGEWISYATWSNASSDLSMVNHLVRPDGSQERRLPAPDGTVWELGGAWSNDATRMLVIRGSTAGWEESRAVIVPVDGSGEAVEIPSDGPIQSGCCYAWEWSPDDSTILGLSNTVGRQVLIDVASRKIAPTPWTATDHPAWQRVVP